jgi:adenosylcobinamide-phosphate synthase
MGAVLYRMAEFMSRYWTYKSHTTGVATHERLGRLSAWLFMWMDHVPARLTAFGFAVVGNFEEAVESWRRHAGLWAHPNEGILLSAAAGALGVQLGGRQAPAAGLDVSRTFTEGEHAEAANAHGSTGGVPPQLAHLRNVVALIWRSMVLWMLLLALLSLANLVG